MITPFPRSGNLFTLYSCPRAVIADLIRNLLCPLDTLLVVASRHCEERSNLDELRPPWTKGSLKVPLLVG